MNEETKYIELAKKLKALADKGSGGEKYNAQKQLDKIMQKYGITKEMLEEDTRIEIAFKFPQKHRTLFIQTCLSVIGSHRKAYFNRKKKTTLMIEVTKIEEAEIRAKYNFYSREWEDQLEIFEMAFVQKNNLFPQDGEKKSLMDLPEKERERAIQMLEVAKSIERAQYRKQIK